MWEELLEIALRLAVLGALALTAELALPGFDEWVAAYRSDPARYDEELLGLWRDPA